jgi:Uma2 family endonuclease
MTVDEYLAWSERQTEKYRTELINGQVVAIAPELDLHNLIVDPDALTVTHYVRDRTPRVLNGGPLRLDPPGIDLTVEDLLGA